MRLQIYISQNFKNFSLFLYTANITTVAAESTAVAVTATTIEFYMDVLFLRDFFHFIYEVVSLEFTFFNLKKMTVSLNGNQF